MQERTPSKSKNGKRPQHPLITFLWALIVALVVLNVMMMIKLASAPATKTDSTVSNLSSLDNNSVEI